MRSGGFDSHRVHNVVHSHLPLTIGGAMKLVFTTGEAAKICKVSQQTIIRCFDNGEIPGSFKVPGSTHRRIPRNALYRFMKSRYPREIIEAAGLNGELESSVVSNFEI